VLASRTGKSETEILKEEVKAEKPKVRATAATAAAAKAAGSGSKLPSAIELPAGVIRH
jgi:hypothetical protein